MLCSKPIPRTSHENRTRSRRILSTLVGFALVWNGSSLAFSQDDVIFWSRPEFIIPFQVDSNGTPPREVILEASDDLGATWYVVSRGDVRTRQFRFRSPKNGDYIFRLKMVDESGRTFNNPGEPLRICVDTEKPTAKLAIDMDTYGDLNARIQIAETNLDKESVKLEYQTEETQEWQSISFELDQNKKTEDWLGIGTWTIPPTTRQIIVRLSGRDKAGNAFEVTRTPDIPKTAAGRSGIQFASQPGRNSVPNQVGNSLAIGSGAAMRPDGQSPEGLPRVQIVGQHNVAPNLSSADSMGAQQQLIENQQKLIEQLLNQQRQEAAARALDPTLKSERSSTVDSRGIPDFGLPVSKRDSSQAFEIGPPTTVGPPTTESTVGNQQPRKNTFLDSTKTNRENSPIRALSDEELLALNSLSNVETPPTRVAEVGRRTLDGQQTLSQHQNLPLSSANELKNSSSLDTPSLPSLGLPAELSSQPLFSGTRAFSLEYGIENDLGVPVRTVELWGTADAGKTWDYWGDDPDRTSPFDIEVEEDGLFGFRMVIVGNNGLAQNRPKNGDDADAWVKVDTVPPKVRIQSALYGRGPEAGSLIIEYLAIDPDFGDRPISLYYSSTSDGPWQEITSGLTNSGKYAWAANPNLPPEIFLKVKAIDAAGNLSEHTMDIPIKVQGIAPRGKIRGIGNIPRTSVP
ncbi:MAG: hypothetical protein MUC83_06475 [Pirellula sp.]|nr:hypothetical protein [Pirellula sp.]